MIHMCKSSIHASSFSCPRTLEKLSTGVAGLGLVQLLVLLLQLLFLLLSLSRLCFSISLPATTYLPKGMEGRIPCPEEASPPLTLIIWKKNDKIIDDDHRRIMIDDQGTLIINSVIGSDEGNYTCTPYSPLSNIFSSFLMRIIVKDIPSFAIRPLSIYQRLIGETVTMHCVADGDPRPDISWKKVDGPFPPTTKTLHDGGNLTIAHLGFEDHGSYECIAQNIVTTIITTTLLIVRASGHGSPYNVTVEVTDITARISWLPPYIGSDQINEYKCELWCQSEDSDSDSWQRFDAIPDNVTTVTVYNLQPNTQYKFKIMSNYSGRPHFSREFVVRTKNNDVLPFHVTSSDDEELNSGDYSGSSTSARPETTFVPSQGHRPAAPFNVSVQQFHDGGVNISWLPSRRSPVPIDYFLVQYNASGQWLPLSGKIDGGQTHFVGAVPSLGPTYQFRVISFGRDLPSDPSNVISFVKNGPANTSGGSSSSSAGGIVCGVIIAVLLVVLLVVALRTYRTKWRRKQRETVLATTEYASTSIHRTLEGRASPILETLSIISNHSQVRNNDHELRHCHETPI